jgi:capsular exopolysaccharide synthesis family protein
MGLGLPFAAVFVKEFFNTTLQLKKDVELATSVPLIGEIAHNDTDQKLVVTKKSRTSISEIFQLVRANLLFATSGSKSQVILVTSGMSGEGKSFFSLNLGASIGLTGKKVALLEFDLRHPEFKQDLSLPSQVGLTDYLRSETISIQDLFAHSLIAPNLYVISAGNQVANPIELMMHPKLQLLFDELKTIFDYIILDTAPVGLVADAYALAPYADAAVFLMRYNFTNKNQIALINEIQANKKFRQPLIVLNDAKKTNGYSSVYGYEEADKGKAKKKTVGV